MERMRIEEWLERVMVRAWPRTGLGGWRVNGRGVRVSGSTIEVMVRERVSTANSPEKGAERVRRVAVWMVEEGKSK